MIQSYGHGFLYKPDNFFLGCSCDNSDTNSILNTNSIKDKSNAKVNNFSEDLDLLKIYHSQYFLFQPDFELVKNINSLLLFPLFSFFSDVKKIFISAI